MRSWRVFVIVASLSWGALGNTPIVLPTTQTFDGFDGPWSTFWIQVGTPPQPLKVLPGTSAAAGSATWVVRPEGCSQANPGLDNCASLRGNVFNPNQSSTWSTSGLANNGIYSLVQPEEDLLGLSGAGAYGFDTVQLGIANSPPTLRGQLVAGIATNNYWLGMLGLSPNYFDFSNYSNPIPSLVMNLRNITPSNSWAYTAGAYYTSPPTFGSLVIGGFDDTRRDPNRTLYNIPFYDDSARDLLAALQQISYSTKSGGAASLMNTSSGAYMFIDSMVSELWLPEEVCDQFEQAFNLTWNSTAELYFVDNFTHQSLLSANPTFTFSLAVNFTTSDTVNISLPYAAFDLSVSQPVVENGTRQYFPLKRAKDSSQFTLGRVFLQGAYLITNYDSRNFTIAQARYPPPGTATQIYQMLPPNFKPFLSNTPSKKMSAGAIAGIVIGAIIAVTMSASVLWFLRRVRARKQRPLSDGEKDGSQRRLGQFAKPELEANGRRRDDLSAVRATTAIELHSGEERVKQEMANDTEVFEMPVMDVPELAGRERAAELEPQRGMGELKA